MSADNWAECPKCKVELKKKRRELYGNVPESEYLAELDKIKNQEVNTMREDYEVYTDASGSFIVSYSCFCEVCKFHFGYEYQQQIYPGVDGA